MKYLFHIGFVILFIFTLQNLQAQNKKFGLGIIIGEPTGVSAKLWTSSANAFDFGLGWSVFDNRNDSKDRVHFHMDYLWHSFNAISSSERFPLYYGIGGRLKSGAGYNSSFAIRGVIGIAWLPRDTPLDIFLEVVPSLQLVTSTGFEIDAGIGARFFF